MNDYVLYRNAWRCYSAPHREMKLSENQCKTLLKQGGFFVRNTYDFDQKEINSFWYIIKDNFEGFETFPSKMKNKFRKAFKSYDYNIIDIETILEQGFEIYKTSLDNYPTKDRNVDSNIFKSLISNNLTEKECWGCFEKSTKKLVGFSVNNIFDDACSYDVSAVLPDCKHNTTYPFYGLFYKMNEYYLVEKKMRYITDGTRSITQHSDIQEFLIHNFNFRKAYCKLNLHYQLWFGIIVKTLYPFRKLITIPNVKAILRQEEFFRNQTKQ